MQSWKFNARRPLVAVVALAAAVGLGSVWQRQITAEPPARGKQTQSDTAAQHEAKGISRAFRQAADEILPTVVTIETRTKAHAAAGDKFSHNEQGEMQENPFKGTPFEDFFGGNSPFSQGHPGGKSPRQFTPKKEGTGSGVIIDKSGIILTNNHVVEGADEVLVRLSDGREFKATDIKTDPQTDLAVLRVKADGSLPAATLGNSDELEIGDWVIAVGNPFGLDSTVSAGIISGKHRELGRGQRTRYLQTDAAINPGNSGGPLVNLDGDVIGINTAIASNSGGYQGIGFAIPINRAKWVTDQLIKSGIVSRAYLGVGIEMVNADLAQKFGVQRGEGVLVAEIFPNSPAVKAGFKEGDIITSFNGTAIKNPRDLQELVEQANLDSKQEVKVLRDGKSVTLEVVVKALPKDLGKVAGNESEENSASPSAGFQSKELGMEVTNMTPEQAQSLGLKDYKGVLVSDVSPDGLAAEVGLREGMLILKVGKKPVENVDQFKQAVTSQSLKDGVLLLVRTEQGNRFIVIKSKE
jgi:serine protease Do